MDSTFPVDRSDPNSEPAVGDFTICAKCGVSAKFGYGYQLEKLTEAEWSEFLFSYHRNNGDLPGADQSPTVNMILIVPTALHDAINSKLDAALAECPGTQLDDREALYAQLLEYFDEHGVVPEFRLVKIIVDPPHSQPPTIPSK
jgi:hypothetical protein